ncbi:MAG TPA: cation:proton antiporter [Gemmatimonadaceae bacterium]|nr:cation:proton antiporter [Gemmatimonadaceae bacterium]
MAGMSDAHAFLQNLALVLCTAAVTTVVFQRLRQPVVFGYLLAGMIVGPHTPIPLNADEAMVRTLSELGVILLMFSLGLEFRLKRVVQVAATSGVAALFETSMMLGLGFLVGRALGWTTIESIFAGAMVAISSTTIVARALAEQDVRGRLTEIVFGILIVEDLIAIFLVAVLTAIAVGGGISPESLGLTAIRLLAFLVGLIGFGLLIVPRLIRTVIKLDKSETTLVATIGICFAAALLALGFGYSVALGAFIAGSLVAESGESVRIEQYVHPVRDMFVAIFFVSVGMLIEPRVIVEHAGAITALVVLVIVGKVVSVTVGSFLTGNGLRSSMQAGMSLAQIGEFSFIIAAVGLAAGVTRDFLYPVAVTVSAITTLTTPWLIRSAGPAAMWVDRKLPRPLQTTAALYGSWIERMQSAPPQAGRSRVRGLVRVLVIDAVLLAVVIVAAAVETDRINALLRTYFGVSETVGLIIVTAGALIIATPLVVGIFRSARRLGFILAVRALPSAGRRAVDFAGAPRRALVAILQLAMLMLVAVPLLAVTQPFLPLYPGIALILVVILLLGIGLWRSALNLQGHAQAGAQMIVSALAPQVLEDESDLMMKTMEHVALMLPGLGDPEAVRIAVNSPAVERTLAELNIRGLTGATVLAITRLDSRIPGEPMKLVQVPSGSERLHVGDILALAGSHEAIRAARSLLVPPNAIWDRRGGKGPAPTPPAAGTAPTTV